MSAPELPDDPRDWPTDPFALLGVTPATPEADVKRAYARLIRRFKPEHAPEQFPRIRAAYETCLEFARHFQPPPDAPDDFRPSQVVRVIRPEPPPEQPRTEPVPEPPPEPAHVVPPREPAPAVRRASRVSAADRLWADAIDGRLAEAYTGLVGQAGERPESPDVPLRLYWLLALNPVLDADRTRHHWLAEALARSRLRGSAAELYRRELEADPQTALYHPYAPLLSAPAADADLLAVARWRIAAAGHGREWGPAYIDLVALRERLTARDEAAWLGLLVAAHGWAVWDRPEPPYGWCEKEFDRLRHLALRHAQEFDRVDEGKHLSAVWAGVEGRMLPEAVRELIRRAWAGGDPRPADVHLAAAVVAAQPVGSLDRFDRALQFPRLTHLLAFLLRVFESHRAGEPDQPEYPPELLRGVFRAWAARRLQVYAELRPALPEFLATEAVGPLELAEACASDPAPTYRELAPHLRDDLSLRLVWAAIRVRQG